MIYLIKFEYEDNCLDIGEYINCNVIGVYDNIVHAIKVNQSDLFSSIDIIRFNVSGYILPPINDIKERYLIIDDTRVATDYTHVIYYGNYLYYREILKAVLRKHNIKNILCM